VRDGAGALVALGRDGGARWSRPAPRGLAPPRSTSPLVVRGTVFAAAGDEVLALDVRTGDLLGALPAPAPVRLLADPGMGVVALDADGLATFFRLARHLSVVPGAD
jgi:hypothetical protein